MNIKKYDWDILSEYIADPIELAPLLQVPRDTKNFILNAPQKAFLQSDKKYTYFVAHRRAGKCIAGNTEIIDPDTLKLIKIKDAQNIKSNFVFDFKKNKIVETQAEWFNSGKKECLRLDFLNGSKIDLSTDHELFTKSKGWVKAEDIVIGDLILAPSSIPIFGTLNPSDSEIDRTTDECIFFNSIESSIFSYSEKALKRFFRFLFTEHGRLFAQENLILLHLKTHQMMKDIHHLLLRLGVWSEMDQLRTKIIIRDEIDVCTFLYKIGLGLQPTDVNPLRRWLTVSEISRIGLQNVYDIGVHHEDHNFIANDLVVHNSLVATYKAVHLAITEKDKNIYVLAPSDKQVKLFFDSITDWITSNPVIQQFWDRSGKNNNSQGSYIKTFITGSKIVGHTTGNQESLRGITGHYFFLDEAQEFSEEVWHAIGPFLRGDEHKVAEGGLKSFIIGTTNKPGEFYDVLLKKDDPEWLSTKGKDYGIVFWPADKRVEIGDLNPAIFDQWKSETPSETEWNQEFLLKLGGGDTAVFKFDELQNAFTENYTYSDEEFSNLPHFMGVDWDKAQSGVNIVIVEYNPMTQEMKTVWREEFESTELHYVLAARRIVELFTRCNPKLVVYDGMAVGQAMIDVLQEKAMERGIHSGNTFLPIFLNKKIECFNEALNVMEKQEIKSFLVSSLRNRMQQGKFKIAPGDHVAKTQFNAYKIEQIKGTSVKYSSKHEHIIDCFMFISYGIYLTYEGPEAELNPSAPSVISNYEEIRQAMRPKIETLDTWVKDTGTDGFSDWSSVNPYRLRTGLGGNFTTRTLI